MINIKKHIFDKPICVGSGLVALDVILNGTPSTPAKLCAGGSCGNVLSILSFLGWDSKPVARLAENQATKNLFDDFLNFKINTSLITSTKDGITPIIIHRILKDKEGNPKHKFEFKIPETNTWLPSYKPVLAKEVENIVKKQNTSNVYYFDRVSRSTVDLAKYYKNIGALIIFEPSSYKEDKLYLESLKIADIIKFSNDRISNYSNLFPTPNAHLEIETMGKEGLRYRLKSESNCWIKINSYELSNIIDTAGAGDWCTAGILNELGFNGSESFYKSDRNTIEKALKIGQVFGGINCKYDGARGIMYNMSYSSLLNLSEMILNNSGNLPEINDESVKIKTIKNFKIESII